MAGLGAAINDEVLEQFSLQARWDDMADTLLARYGGKAARVVSYLTMDDIQRNPEHLARWGEIGKALRLA